MAVQKVSCTINTATQINRNIQNKKNSTTKIERNDNFLLKSEALKNNAIANISFKGYEKIIYSKQIPEKNSAYIEGKNQYFSLNDEINVRYRDKDKIIYYPIDDIIKGNCKNPETGSIYSVSDKQGKAEIYVFEPDDYVTENDIAECCKKYNYVIKYKDGGDIVSKERIESVPFNRLGYIIEDLEDLTKSYEKNVEKGKENADFAQLEFLNAEKKQKSAKEKLSEAKGLIKLVSANIEYFSAQKNKEKAQKELDKANEYYNSVTNRKAEIEERIQLAKERYAHLEAVGLNEPEIELFKLY